MKRSTWLILTYTFVGPLLGGLGLIAVGIAADSFDPNRDASSEIGYYWPIFLTGTYAFGFVPAFAAGVVAAIATRWLPTWPRRLTAAPIIGGLTSLALIGGFLALDGPEVGIQGEIWWLYLTIFATGAVSALLCQAIVEPFHPLPARASA